MQIDEPKTKKSFEVTGLKKLTDFTNNIYNNNYENNYNNTGKLTY